MKVLVVTSSFFTNSNAGGAERTEIIPKHFALIKSRINIQLFSLWLLPAVQVVKVKASQIKTFGAEKSMQLDFTFRFLVAWQLIDLLFELLSFSAYYRRMNRSHVPPTATGIPEEKAADLWFWFITEMHVRLSNLLPFLNFAKPLNSVNQWDQFKVKILSCRFNLVVSYASVLCRNNLRVSGTISQSPRLSVHPLLTSCHPSITEN